MGIVRVKYLGNFSLITRKRQEEIPIGEGTQKDTIRSLMNKLSQKYGREFDKLFDNPMTVIWVNGEIVDKDRVLKGGDELVLHYRDELIIGTLAGGG